MEFKVGFVCDRGLNPKRPVNQDRYLALADSGLFAVFDGVGGQRAGEVASQTAADTIEEALTHSSAKSSAEAVRRAIEFANRDILELAENDSAYRTMATTVALVHIDGERAIVAHVGDSRVYRLEDGRFHRETIDHTDSNDHLRNGSMAPQAGGTQTDQNVINRALGVEPAVDVEIKAIPIRDGARLLLCSDGIYKHIPDQEIARVLTRNNDPQNAADELKRIVYQRGADDNLTAVVVQVGRARKTEAMTIDPSKNAEGAGARSDRANRIEVQLAREESRPEDLGKSRASRKLMYLLIALVLMAGAFYAGLRASQFVKLGPSPRDSSPPNDSLGGGIEEFQKGRYREAAAMFTSVLAREPQNSSASYWLGRSQLELGEYQNAAENLEKASAKMPEADLFGAAAYKAAGNKTKADALLDRYNEGLRSKTGTRGQGPAERQ